MRRFIAGEIDVLPTRIHTKPYHSELCDSALELVRTTGEDETPLMLFKNLYSMTILRNARPVYPATELDSAYPMRSNVHDFMLLLMAAHNVLEDHEARRKEEELRKSNAI